MRQDTADALLRELASAQAESRLPSVVAGLVRDGAPAWSATRGRFATAAGHAPTIDTQYRIGSITKTMTAVLVMRCRDDGLLSLDDAVGKHLPGIGYGDRTVRQLLAHSSGMHAEPAGDWWERSPGAGFEELEAVLDDRTAPLAPGRQHHYSNLGYALLGEVVARLRGASWWELVRDRILLPLEMRRTSYLPEPPAAQGFSVQPWSGRLDEEPAYDAEAMAPAGQLWSTVEDLSRYTMFWLDPVAEVLGPDTVAEMAIPQAADPTEGLTASYGLGLRLQADGERVLAGHTGSMPGFLAGLFVDRDRRLGAATLANATAGRCGTLPVDLVRIAAEHEPPLPAEWMPERLEVAAELLGPWYWGNTGYALSVSGGFLKLDGLAQGRPSRFVPVGPDTFVGLDGYFAGERLHVRRDAAGAVVSLELVTYVFHRTPYGS